MDVSWQVVKEGDYCLYSTQQSPQLKCWLNSNRGSFQADFVVNQNVTFTLTSQHNNVSIVSSALELDWVHKAQRLSHSSWRVFERIYRTLAFNRRISSSTGVSLPIIILFILFYPAGHQIWIHF